MPSLSHSTRCLLSLLQHARSSLSCGIWDLVPWAGIEPRPPALGMQSLSHWTTREVLWFFIFTSVVIQSVQSISRVQLDPMNHSTPGLPVHHQLPEFTQTRVHWVGDAIQPSISSSAVPFSSCLQSFPASRSFQMSQLFTSGGQNIEVSASGSVFPMHI